MSLVDRQYRYKVLSLNLGIARDNVAEGLTKKINTLTILTLGNGTLEFKLNLNTNDTIPGSSGLKIECIPTTELFWTNVAQAGKTAKVFIVWID
jgi:hypothetical protein